MTRHLADRLAGSPELAAAVTPALLGSDPDVERLRLRIGGEFVDRFRAALGEDADPAVLETLALAFSGALLQSGMGLMTYTEMADRLDSVVAVIMKGNCMTQRSCSTRTTTRSRRTRTRSTGAAVTRTRCTTTPSTTSGC